MSRLHVSDNGDSVARPPKGKNSIRKDPGAQPAPQDHSLRADPAPRSVRGPFSMATLRNQDPSRHYVWVSTAKSDDADPVDDYSALGYVIEKSSGDGVTTRGGRTCKPGEDITYRGSVLMSIDKAEHERIIEYGPEGDPDDPSTWGGQRGESQREKRYIVKRGMRDTLRGLVGFTGGDGINVSGEVTAR